MSARLGAAARWVGRGLTAALLVASGGVAAKRGQAALPPAPSGVAPAVEAPRAGETVERAEMLIDRLDEARFSVPKLDAAVPAFRAAHWRAMTSPHAKASGARRKAVQFVAFTVGGTEKMSDEPSLLGASGAKDLRTWNSAEASFDAREAILAPPPSEIGFRMTVPPGARLEVSPAVGNLKAGAVTFEVAVRPKGGERRVLRSMKIRASELFEWRDMAVDLGEYAGREVELELATRGGTLEPSGALWGAPVVISSGPPPVPYNVLWFVIDTMRPDPLEAWHSPERDAALAQAKTPPLEAWLPAMPTVAPRIDELARKGAAFVDATSAATWTRPGTLSMLAGARSSQIGLDTTPWILPAATVTRFYASSPPLLPLMLRRRGVRSQAFVNNFFLTGYARAGVDVGFPGMLDHRHETLDTNKITTDALGWLERHRQERFFLFVNLNSPHGPYAPPERHRKQVPRPPLGPREEPVRLYLGEIAKDDEAVGKIVDKLGELGLTDKTLVIVTADHGETLSREHNYVVKGIDVHGGATRFHHANAMFEETTRVPLVMALPGQIPAGARPKTPVQTTDIVPTILEVLGVPAPDKVRGKSLLAWARGAPDEPERPVVSEGRAARSVRVGRWRYVERDSAAREVSHPERGPRATSDELYDLIDDPGEREDVVTRHPDVAARMRERLAEALASSTSQDVRQSAALAGSRHQPRDSSPPARVRLRFVGGGAHRRFTISARLADPEPGAPEPKLRAEVVQADPSVLRVEGRTLDATFTTLPSEPVGLDLEISPASASLSWEIRLDEAALSPEQLFGGPYGLAAPLLMRGIHDADARLAATADALPALDPRRDLGVFVTREPAGDVGLALPQGGEALGEVKKLLEVWGYAAPATK